MLRPDSGRRSPVGRSLSRVPAVADTRLANLNGIQDGKRQTASHAGT